MAKGTSFCNSLVDLIYRATAIANIADNAASSPITNIQMALHTASPGAGGGQNTNETSYTNYARVAVARSGAGWSAASAGQNQNAALTQFAQCGVTGATVTFVSTGRDASGAGLLFHFGALNSSLAVSNGIQPQFSAGGITIQES